MHDLVSSVIIWPQAEREADYLSLKMNFLVSKLESVFLAFVLSDSVAVLGILKPKKLEVKS